MGGRKGLLEHCDEARRGLARYRTLLNGNIEGLPDACYHGASIIEAYTVAAGVAATLYERALDAGVPKDVLYPLLLVTDRPVSGPEDANLDAALVVLQAITLNPLYGVSG